MTDIYSYISIISFFITAFVLSRILRPSNRVEGILSFILFFSLLIVSSAYLLSNQESIANYSKWAIIALINVIITITICFIIKPLRLIVFRKLSLPHEIEEYIKKSSRDNVFRILVILSVVTAAVFLINFAICIMLEPANLDSFDYHLARIAYYLQNGSMDYFAANYWNQVIYPKVATCLQLFCYLMGGRLMNMATLPQFFSSIVSVIAIIGICRQCGINRKISLLTGLMFSLLTIVITEAASPQNDLLLTAYAACTVYYMLAFRNYGRQSHLILAILAVSLMIGVKFTFLLAMPSLLILLIFIIPRMCKIKYWIISLLSLILFTMIIIIPSGYGENYKLFKDPLGPKDIRQQYTTEGASTVGKFIKVGAINLARYSVQALSTAEMRAIPGWDKVDNAIIASLKYFYSSIGLNLESDYGAKFKFSYQPMSLANENISQFGIIGILLIWPAILIGAFHKKSPVAIRVTAICALLYFIIQGVSTPYDHFHGRYLMVMAIFASPAIAWALSNFKRWYVITIILFACASGISSAFFRNGTNIFPYTVTDHKKNKSIVPSMFVTDRMTQLTREAPGLFWMLNEIERMPEDAVVGVDYPLINYLFFGEKLSRHIVPLIPYSNQDVVLPLPAGLDYLICIDQSPYRTNKDRMILPNDKYFGEIYMRDLRNKAK